LEESPEILIPEQEDVGYLSEAVVDVFAGEACDVDQPIEVFEGNHRGVEVDSSEVVEEG
jgi:hypothetical protein